MNCGQLSAPLFDSTFDTLVPVPEFSNADSEQALSIGRRAVNRFVERVEAGDDSVFEPGEPLGLDLRGWECVFDTGQEGMACEGLMETWFILRDVSDNAG